MESQPQNPEFKINPENFHPCFIDKNDLRYKKYNFYMEITSCDLSLQLAITNSLYLTRR